MENGTLTMFHDIQKKPLKNHVERKKKWLQKHLKIFLKKGFFPLKMALSGKRSGEIQVEQTYHKQL